MKNLAGVPGCDDFILGELDAAGIEAYRFPFDKEGEVPTRIVGVLGGWTFRRAWYYYMATGPGIPPDLAEQLHTSHGTVVRVEGHCGCPSPLEWCGGFAVGSYHIDSQDGLTAFADLLRRIVATNTRQLGAASRWSHPRIDDAFLVKRTAVVSPEITRTAPHE